MTGPAPRANPLLYNTNGFAFHRLEDAVAILAELGFDGIALTPDVHHLDPLRASRGEVRALRARLDELGLGVVVETGARFVLDPRRKHRPSLLDEAPDAGRRLDFLRRCVDLAVELGAGVVSTWSGAGPDDLDPEEAIDRLADGLARLCAHAAGAGVRIGFEPEPGMAVDTTAAWPQVREAVAHPALGLTLDVGHCLAVREGDPARIVRRYAADLVVLQLDDHRAGRHEHLMFGEGDVAWPELAAAVREAGYAGPLEVELSRHSSDAPAAARASRDFLRALFPSA